MSPDPDEPLFPLPKMEPVDSGPSWALLVLLFAGAFLAAVVLVLVLR